MIEENVIMKKEVEKESFSPDAVPHAENIENMTVIDEVTDEAERKAESDSTKDETVWTFHCIYLPIFREWMILNIKSIRFVI